MRLAAATSLVLGLLVAAGPARAQEHRDHTHHPDRGTTDAGALLRMVATLQASYNASKGRYASKPEELRIPPMRAIQLHLTANGSSGYTAVAVSATEECVLYRGAVRPPREYATEPNQVVCRPLAGGTRGRS
jgi:hypothetical protein